MGIKYNMNQKLFFYLQHPDYFENTENKSPYYALHVPSVNRLLLIITNLEVAQFLSVILASRTPVVPIRIEKSENFSTELIDNAVCTNWGLDKTTSDYNQFSLPLSKNIYIHKSRLVDLKPLPNKLNEMLLIAQKWAFLGYYTREFFKKNTDIMYRIAYDLIDTIDNKALRNLKEKERACYNSIWVDDVYETAEAKVLGIIDSIKGASE